MTRMLFALALAGTAAVGSARADWGGIAPPQAGPIGAPPPGPQYGPPPGYPVQAGAAQTAPPATLAGYMTAPSGKAPDRYGLLPSLRRSFRIGEGCDTCGGKAHKPLLGGLFHGKGGCGPDGCGDGRLGHGLGHGFGHGGAGGGYGGHGNGYDGPQMMQGTLVFPHHTYVRSPRDFFMYEPGR